MFYVNLCYELQQSVLDDCYVTNSQFRVFRFHAVISILYTMRLSKVRLSHGSP